MPSFAGQTMFGPTTHMWTRDNPRAEQRNAFAGASGIESIDLGSRGRFTQCKGRHQGIGIAGMAASQEFFRSYKDGYAYTLVDTRGVTWLYVKLISYDPQGNPGYDGADLWGQGYTATFFHLI